MSSTDVVAKNQQTSLVNTPTTTDDTKVSKAAVDVVDEEEEEEAKPNASFDYCEDIARVAESAQVAAESLEIKEELIDEGLKPPDEDDGDREAATAEEEDNDMDERPASVLKIEENNTQSIIELPPPTSHGEGLLSPSEEAAAYDAAISDPKSIETFFNAFEEHIRCRDKESQCSYMEAYGFVITFRYVYEQKEREKDTELAINALLARYTGIESLNVLQVFLESLNANGELDEFKTCGLQPIDCILVTYIQLKVCISFRDLAKVFESDVESVQACFLSTINKIKKTLGSVIYWPSREETEMTIPKFFKPAYSNVRTIFTNLVVQKNEVSKQRYVIGFAPSGFVSYISNSYNAVTYSDERIFREEKIRQRFERNQDALMVLDGFPIENLLGINNFRVFRPPFLVKTILPDNKSRVYENTALYKHVLGLTTIFEKFLILSCKNLNHNVEELVFCVCVCNNYNILFRNT